MPPPRTRLAARRWMIALAAAAALVGARAAWIRAAGPVQEPAPGRPKGPIVEASLIRLIADPDRFDGKAVRVDGFLHVEFEDMTLYLSRDDANHLITRNGVWLDFGPELAGGSTKVPGPKSSNRKFVLIEGIFDKGLTGHMGGCSGGIRGIWRVMDLTKFFND